MRKKVFAGVLGLAMLLGLPTEAAPGGNELPGADRTGVEDSKAATSLPETPGPVAPGNVLPANPEFPPGGQAPSKGQEPATPAIPSGPIVPVAPEAQTVPSSQTGESTAPQQEPQPLKIVINLASRSLAVYEGDRKIRLYPVGVGTTSTPTPTGYYKIRSKDVNPTWTDPGDPSNSIPSGPSNPLGYRWMEIKGNYGIHGTNNPSSVGHYVSNGCIRLQEKDVEALFDLVEIGTPVEITYNRVVVEKTPENIVAYYIYPDGYYRQKLDVATVNQWLAGYGVSAFESDEDIAQKIEASDGQPTYIGAIYGIAINGKRIPVNAVARDNVIYLPAVPIAENAGIDLNWDAARSMLVSPYGEVSGLDKKGQLYLKAADARTLFRMAGTLQADNVFSMQSIASKPAARPVLERNVEMQPSLEPSQAGTAQSSQTIPPDPGAPTDQTVQNTQSAQPERPIFDRATDRSNLPADADAADIQRQSERSGSENRPEPLPPADGEESARAAAEAAERSPGTADAAPTLESSRRASQENQPKEDAGTRRRPRGSSVDVSDRRPVITQSHREV